MREGVSCGARGKRYATVSQTEIRDPPERRIAQWRAAARKGSIFSCKGPDCITIVETIPQNEHTDCGLAACEISKIRGTLGAPKNCTELYRKDEGGEFFTVAIGTTSIACDIGRPDFKLVILGLDQNAFSTVLNNANTALSSKPLELRTDVYQTYVLGVADGRLSPVLPDSREIITVRIDIERGNYFDALGSRFNQSAGFGAVVSTNLLVNRQNTDRPNDWHRGNPSQEQAYVAAVEAALKKQISEICPDSKWLDDRNMRCAKSK
jgi:hypothetical protein